MNHQEEQGLASEKKTNKGTGAGGSNTNINGKSFEMKTSNEPRLLESGFVRKNIPGASNKSKSGFYLVKEMSPTTTVVYFTQGGLMAYFKHFFGKEMCRCPDEAYLFKHGCDDGASYTLKILEKKNQNTDGSVDTKLLAGKAFIDEYTYCLTGDDDGGDGGGGGETAFTVEYAFCINEFLKKDYIADTVKSKAIRFIHKKDRISVLFGDDTDYFETLDAWLFGG
jgi:hypothetical protein